MNARTTLICETDGTRAWIIRDNIVPLGLEPEQLTWSELPLSTDTIGEIISVLSIHITNYYIIMRCNIRFPEKSENDDQPSSEDIYERKAIIAWDVRDINRIIPIYIQKDDEVRDNAPLPGFVCPYPPWILGFTHIVSDSQPNNTSYRYFIYNFDRKSYYPFGPIYTHSDAHIQSATEYYVQIIILHFNSDDMEVSDKGTAITDDKPAGLRVHWRSYIFDDEHSAGLEGHNGEIIMPMDQA
jgi:hypothetical protein